MGKRDFYENLVRRFVEGPDADSAATVRQHLETGEREAAERAAASLKGVAGTIGASELQSRAQALEAGIREETGEVDAQLQSTQEELERLVGAIRQVLGVGGQQQAVESVEAVTLDADTAERSAGELESQAARVDELAATLTINDGEDESAG